MSSKRRNKVDDDDVLVLTHAEELATSHSFERGTQVLIDETQERFYCAGYTTRVIATRLGWTQANIWVPDHAKQNMEDGHPEFTDHLRAIEIVVTRPISVHDVPEEPNQIQFFANANVLRDKGVIRSRSMETVDVLIKLRLIHTETYLRAFHLSPMRHTRGGHQLWP